MTSTPTFDPQQMQTTSGDAALGQTDSLPPHDVTDLGLAIPKTAAEFEALVRAQSDSTAAGGTLAPGALGLGGASQAHDNMMPYTVVNFCIALYGIFPSRN